MNQEEFTITTEGGGGTSVNFVLKGPVSTMTAKVLQKKLDDALEYGKNQIVVNMAMVNFLSSTGIRVLLSTYKNAIKNGGTFHIDNPSENVINVLGMTALDEMMLNR